MLISGRVEIEETQRGSILSGKNDVNCKGLEFVLCIPFPVPPIPSNLGIPGYPWPLKASRKVTLRLASSKKLRSESKVKTCSLEAHHW